MLLYEPGSRLVDCESLPNGPLVISESISQIEFCPRAEKRGDTNGTADVLEIANGDWLESANSHGIRLAILGPIK